VKKIINNKKAFGFVDSGVKILIAVVIGALVLGGTYTLTKDTVMATAKTKVEELFNYQGEAVEEEEPTLISFTVWRTTFKAEEGMTFGEWVSSEYNTTKYYVITNNFIGTEGENGTRTRLYYLDKNRKEIYVKSGDTIENGKLYDTSHDLPFIPF